MHPLNVLFFSSDDLVAQVRLIPLLEILRASGRIAYGSVSRDMRLSGPAGPFDVCLVHRSPGKRQIKWLRQHGVPLLYDIDDLLAKPPGSAAGSFDPVRWCLDHAAVVTAASPRLLATLEDWSAGHLAGRAVLLPNAGRESAPPEKISGKAKLIWISSAQPKAATELTQVCAGIARAAKNMSAESILVGPFPRPIIAQLPNATLIPWIEPRMLLDWLAPKPLIAVAPLSTDLLEADQRFADCKSDIKVAQYGSSGIAGLYSNAFPYTDSDLPCRIVARNDEASWTAGILDAAASFPDEGTQLAQHAAFARRRPSVLAERLFAQLERVAAIGKPFTFRAIPTPSFARLAGQKIRRWLR